MSGGICKDMNGAKCAENYCDYWDPEEQRCIIAIKDSEMAKYYKDLNKQSDEVKTLSKKIGKYQDALVKGNITLQ